MYDENNHKIFGIMTSFSLKSSKHKSFHPTYERIFIFKPTNILEIGGPRESIAGNFLKQANAENAMCMITHIQRQETDVFMMFVK